jgi:hypothetical protein
MRKGARRIFCVFDKKKKGKELPKADTGTMHPFPSGWTTTRGAARTSNRTTIGGPYGTVTTGAGNSSSFNGTSSSGGTAIEGLCGTGTSSSSGGTTVVLGYDSRTSSSTTRMRFMLGTSYSSYITCVINWIGKTGSSQRQRRW